MSGDLLHEERADARVTPFRYWMVTFNGELLGKRRRERNLSQQRLSYRSRVSLGTIQRVEKLSAASCHIGTLHCLASALSPDPDALICELTGGSGDGQAQRRGSDNSGWPTPLWHDLSREIQRVNLGAADIDLERISPGTREADILEWQRKRKLRDCVRVMFGRLGSCKPPNGACEVVAFLIDKPDRKLIACQFAHWYLDHEDHREARIRRGKAGAVDRVPTPAVNGDLISVGIEDILDVYRYGIPRFYEADEDGDADWLMLGEIPGGLIICVPLASPKSEDYTCCRPIGLYGAVTMMRERYLSELGWMT